jgi:hypothetical protein
MEHKYEDGPFFRDYEQAAQRIPIRNQRETRNPNRAWREGVACKARTQ